MTSVYLLAAAIKQAGSTDGRKIREALENLNDKVEGVVTIYDKPIPPTDHEAITAQYSGLRPRQGRPRRAGPSRGPRRRQGRAHQAEEPDRRLATRSRLAATGLRRSRVALDRSRSACRCKFSPS